MGPKPCRTKVFADHSGPLLVGTRGAAYEILAWRTNSGGELPLPPALGACFVGMGNREAQRESFVRADATTEHRFAG